MLAIYPSSQIKHNCLLLIKSNPAFLHPGFPPWKEAAQVFGVHSLLDEKIHLTAHTEHCSFLHSFQFFLKSHQDAFCHFVKSLVIATGNKQIQGFRKPADVLMTSNENKGKVGPDSYFAFLLHSWSEALGVERTSVSSSGLCCRYRAFKGFMVQSKRGSYRSTWA